MPSNKAFFYFSAFLFLSISLKGQVIDFDKYKPLCSKGNLPKALLLTSTQKYKEQEKSISAKEKTEIKALKQEFYLESTFSLDNLLRRGEVLFNDTIGAYINSILSNIKVAANIENSNIRAYTIKTNYANAFATDEGVIFITTGLISRLKTEGELAFILCHEVIHSLKKHSIDAFLKNNTLFSTGEYVRDIDLIASASYSKEKEIEADKEGFLLFSKLGYSPQNAISALEILQFSHLPFENIVFDKSYFEIGGLQWPLSFSLSEIDSIKAQQENNVLYSTHPDIDERKRLVSPLLGDSIFVKDRKQNSFITIRKICRFEFALYALKKGWFCDAIYASWVLLKEEPNSFFLKKIIGKSLYGISTYFNYSKKNTLKLDPANTQGEFQQVLVFFENMTAYEANALAVNYIWSLKKRYPNDMEINAILKETINSFTLLHSSNINVFKNSPIPSDLKKDNTLELIYNDYILIHTKEESDASVLKSFRRKKFKREEHLNINVDSLLRLDIKLRKKRFPYAFNSIIKDSLFIIALQSSIEKNRALISRLDTVLKNKSAIDSTSPLWVEINPNYKLYLNAYITEKEVRKQLKYDSIAAHYSGFFNGKLKRKKGEKVILFNPIYYSLDERRRIAIKYIASEKTRAVFMSRLKTSAKAAKIPIKILSDNQFEENDASKINTIALVNDWLNEYFIHKDIDILPVEQERVANLSSSINSKYLCFTANTYAIKKKKDVSSYVALSIVFPVYSWPFTLPYLINKKFESRFFMVALNMKDRTVIMANSSKVKAKNKEDISLSTFYRFFSNLKMVQTN